MNNNTTTEEYGTLAAKLESLEERLEVVEDNRM